MSDPTQQEQLDRLLTLEQPLEGLEAPSAPRRPAFRVHDVVVHTMYGHCVVEAVDDLGEFPVYAVRAQHGGFLFRCSSIFLS